MKKQKTTIIYAGLIALIFAGCASVAPITGLVSRDLTRAQELAEKYGDVDAARCYAYLNQALDSELSRENISGVISGIEKVRLLRNHVDHNEQLFKSECGPLSAEVLMGLIRR